MVKLFIGCFASAFAMFIAGFLYFAGPLSMMAYSNTSEVQSASVQAALGANLPDTGTYIVPNPSTPEGTTMYGKGPIATVHYNSKGYPLDSMDGMAWGFALYLATAALMAGALSQLGSRVPDFRSRATIIVLFAIAMPGVIILSDPIFMHQDWTYAIFSFVGSVFILSVGGLVLARWFMPSASQKPKETTGSEEVGTV